MKLYLVAGEASGDARGAELMKALRARLPAVEFLGAGGREMKALAGDAIHDWADEAVVGLWDVLKKYGYFRRQFHRMLAEIDRVQPDAVVFIDYPGFNLRLAHAAAPAKGESEAHLLHLAASLGVAPQPHSEDGEGPGSDALPLPLRGAALRGLRTKNRLCRPSSPGLPGRAAPRPQAILFLFLFILLFIFIPTSLLAALAGPA